MDCQFFEVRKKLLNVQVMHGSELAIGVTRRWSERKVNIGFKLSCGVRLIEWIRGRCCRRSRYFRVSNACRTDPTKPRLPRDPSGEMDDLRNVVMSRGWKVR